MPASGHVGEQFPYLAFEYAVLVNLQLSKYVMIAIITIDMWRVRNLGGNLWGQFASSKGVLNRLYVRMNLFGLRMDIKHSYHPRRSNNLHCTIEKRFCVKNTTSTRALTPRPRIPKGCWEYFDGWLRRIWLL
jgi:hypothetical protein